MTPSFKLNSLSPARGLLAMGLMLAVLEGCSSIRPLQVDRTGQPIYQQLELQCEFRRELSEAAILPAHSEIQQTNGTEPALLADDAQQTQMSGEATPTASPDDSELTASTGEVQPASMEEQFFTGRSTMPEWNRGRVEILCPTPEGNADEALIRFKYWKEEAPLMSAVRTPSAGGDSSFRSRVRQVVFQSENENDWLGGEIPTDPSKVYTREATVPRYKIDFLMSDLNRAGFYEQQHRPVGAAWMTVDVDGGQIEKRWDLEPRLLELVNETLSSEKAFDSERVRFVPAPKKPDIVTISGEAETAEESEPEPEFLSPQEANRLAMQNAAEDSEEETSPFPASANEELEPTFELNNIFAD